MQEISDLLSVPADSEVKASWSCGSLWAFKKPFCPSRFSAPCVGVCKAPEGCDKLVGVARLLGKSSGELQFDIFVDRCARFTIYTE